MRLPFIPATLGRQLLAGAALIFLFGLAGIGTIYFANARLYLQEQLQSHAQDAATSLALSLGAAAPRADAAFVETTINAMFDRGYYERILFVSTSGDTVVSKELATGDSAVPAWFMRMFPLYAPTATSLVNSGWRQLGRVHVTSHPRFAYRQLWRTGVQTAGWLALVLAMSVAALRLFLAGILRPLERIGAAADAIGRRDYRTIEPVPRTRELRQVVLAMNALSAHVRDIIESETARADSLRREAFLDPLTGLWNRRGFAEQYGARIRDDRDVHTALLVLLELDDFTRVNRARGYARGDDLLKLVGAIVEETARAHGGAAVAGRWAGATFLFTVANVERQDAEPMLAAFSHRVEALLYEQDLASDLRFNCGAAMFETGKPELGAMLARADGALLRAQARGPGLYEVDAAAEGAGPALGSMEWRRLLDDALSEGRIALYGQPVMSLPEQKTLHVEVTARLIDPQGAAIPAAQFLPIAARHQQVARIDRTVLERLLERMRSGELGATPLSVNVSGHSAASPEFVRWLAQALAGARADCARLTFEMSESGAMRNPEAALALAATARAAGARFALDNFGVHRESIQTLQRLLPDYVKLSASYTERLGEDPAKRFFVGALVRIARTLDIGVFAQAVEDAALLPTLSELGISGFQGYAAAKPAPLSPQPPR